MSKMPFSNKFDHIILGRDRDRGASSDGEGSTVNGTNAKKQRRGPSPSLRINTEDDNLPFGVRMHRHNQRPDSTTSLPKRRGAMAHVIFSKKNGNKPRTDAHQILIRAPYLFPNTSTRNSSATTNASSEIDPGTEFELQRSTRLLTTSTLPVSKRSKIQCFHLRADTREGGPATAEGRDLADRLNNIFLQSLNEARENQNEQTRNVVSQSDISPSRRFLSTSSGVTMSTSSSRSNPVRLNEILSSALDIVKDIDLQDVECGELGHSRNHRDWKCGTDRAKQ